MKKISVAVVGYGTIGQRLADGVALQDDMELVGIVDMAPTLAIRALYERGMPYALYPAAGADPLQFSSLGIPVSGTFEELIDRVDIILDASPAGIGAKNKRLYEARKKKAIFQGGENDSIADTFFHSYANYKKGLGKQFIKLTSCNTTGLIRAVACLDQQFSIEKVAVTIVRRVADIGDYHRGLVDCLKMEKAPTHQAVDLMTIMPHIHATGILVHTPITWGHVITVVATGKNGKISKNEALAALKSHPRIRVVRIDDGFTGNTSFFKYARDLGHPRGDMYEIGIWEDSIVESGNDIMFAVNIPQEAVTIPETIDGIRAAMKMQETAEEAISCTNRNLAMSNRGSII